MSVIGCGVEFPGVCLKHINGSDYAQIENSPFKGTFIIIFTGPQHCSENLERDCFRRREKTKFIYK